MRFQCIFDLAYFTKVITFEMASNALGHPTPLLHELRTEMSNTIANNPAIFLNTLEFILNIIYMF